MLRLEWKLECSTDDVSRAVVLCYGILNVCCWIYCILVSFLYREYQWSVAPYRRTMYEWLLANLLQTWLPYELLNEFKMGPLLPANRELEKYQKYNWSEGYEGQAHNVLGCTGPRALLYSNRTEHAVTCSYSRCVFYARLYGFQSAMFWTWKTGHSLA